MNTECRDPSRFEERRRRLTLLLELNAPNIIIAREALLVSEAFDGGIWPHVRQVVIEACRRTWNWNVAFPFWRLLCRLRIWHLGQESGGDGCPFCGKGEPEDDCRVCGEGSGLP